MMNRLFKRGMVIALAAAMTTSAGIPAMAAQKETLEETVTTSEVTQTNVDYGSLTQKEIEEFNSIYDRLDAIDKEVMKDADGLSDEDIYARYDQYQDETDTLMDRLEELDKKAGNCVDVCGKVPEPERWYPRSSARASPAQNTC